MKITTWNINGVKARLDGALTYLKEQQLNVICLQEIKSQDDVFPRQPFEDLGYNVVTHGQKIFNGVAILSKQPLEDVRRGLDGDEADTQALSSSWCLRATAWFASSRSTCQMAIPSALRNSPISCNGWPASRRAFDSFLARRSRLFWRAISTSSPEPKMLSVRRPGLTMRCIA